MDSDRATVTIRDCVLHRRKTTVCVHFRAPGQRGLAEESASRPSWEIEARPRSRPPIRPRGARPSSRDPRPSTPVPCSRFSMPRASSYCARTFWFVSRSIRCTIPRRRSGFCLSRPELGCSPPTPPHLGKRFALGPQPRSWVNVPLRISSSQAADLAVADS